MAETICKKQAIQREINGWDDNDLHTGCCHGIRLSLWLVIVIVVVVSNFNNTNQFRVWYRNYHRGWGEGGGGYTLRCVTQEQIISESYLVQYNSSICSLHPLHCSVCVVCSTHTHHVHPHFTHTHTTHTHITHTHTYPNITHTSQTHITPIMHIHHAHT